MRDGGAVVLVVVGGGGGVAWGGGITHNPLFVPSTKRVSI